MNESKSHIIKMLSSILDDMSEMDIVERLYMLIRLEHSIESCEKDGVYTNDEVKDHFANRTVNVL